MIKKIILSNFRNFSFFQSEFEKINIIKGKNGTGKTNLIEAIYFCLNGHPFFKNLNRVKKDLNKPTYLNANLINNTVHITINEENIKKIKLNGKLAKIIDLKKQFPCIDYSINSFISFKNKNYMFSLIDRGVFAQDKTIIDKVIEYKKLIKTKKSLIKENNINKKAIKILNEKLTETIKEISKKRVKLVESIKNDVYNCFNKFHKKKLNISYFEGKIRESTLKEELLKRKMFVSLKKDTLKITIDNMNMFYYSSVGEKKITLLCIVLAILKMYNSRGLLPIFLIDDLEGDLDIDVQEMAFEIIKSLPNQIFVTTLGLYNGYNVINLTEELQS